MPNDLNCSALYCEAGDMQCLMKSLFKLLLIRLHRAFVFSYKGSRALLLVVSVPIRCLNYCAAVRSTQLEHPR